MTFEERKTLVKSYLGKTVDVKIDRPMGYVHKKEKYSLTYPINYGYLPGVIGGDEEERFAATYNEYAQKLQLLYPKTAYIVKEISDRYKCESRFERARELKGYF